MTRSSMRICFLRAHSVLCRRSRPFCTISASTTLKRIFPLPDSPPKEFHPDQPRSDHGAGLWQRNRTALVDERCPEGTESLVEGLKGNRLSMQQVLSHIQQSKPSVDALNSLVSAVVDHKTAEEVFRLLDELEGFHHPESVLLVHVHALAQFTQKEDYRSGQEVWRRIQSVRNTSTGTLPLTPFAYNVALKCCCKLHVSQEIFDLLEDMIQHKVVSSSRTYATCMKFLIEHSSPDAVLSLIRVFLRMPRLPLTSHIFTSMVQFAGSQKEEDLIVSLHESIERRSLITDSTLYRAFIRAYLDCDSFRRATGILEEMKDQGLDGTTEWYAPFVRYLVAQRDSKSERLIDQLEEAAQDLTLEITFINSMISARCQLGDQTDVEGVRRVLQTMKAQQIRPSKITHELVNKFRIQELFREYFDHAPPMPSASRKSGKKQNVPSRKMQAASSVLDLLS